MELLTQGIHLVSTDEMSGIQALERLHPALPMRPRQVERIEFEYIRHGTQTLLANWHVAKGQLINPTIGATRTEEDFKNHIAQTLDTDPEAGWIFIVDQLNIHQSESLDQLGRNNPSVKILPLLPVPPLLPLLAELVGNFRREGLVSARVENADTLYGRRI